MVLKRPNTHKEKEKIIVYDAEPDRISELVEHSGPPKKQRGERKVCGIAFVTTHAELPHEINLLRGQTRTSFAYKPHRQDDWPTP